MEAVINSQGEDTLAETEGRPTLARVPDGGRELSEQRWDAGAPGCFGGINEMIIGRYLRFLMGVTNVWGHTQG